jgi:hypothetical protein
VGKQVKPYLKNNLKAKQNKTKKFAQVGCLGKTLSSNTTKEKEEERT